MKYCLVPYGCQMNISDSERIRSVLEGLGYERTEHEEEANLLGIVACSVRQKAIDKVYSKIHRWNTWKNHKHLITFASGCILPADREKFLDRFDFVFSIQELPQLPEMIRQYGIPSHVSVEGLSDAEAESDHARAYWKIRPEYGSSFEAYVPIQNGCDKFCTFCAVPYTRGREVSRPSQEIIAEVESLVDAGYKSITLLGQNVNSYGLDKRSDEIGFPELLRRIGELGRRKEQRFWVYFTSPHPRDMTDEVLEVIAKYEVLAKQIHLPIQSGDDKILFGMNRNYSTSRYRAVVESLRRILPKATLFTDIIVGFPGESEEQFERTRATMYEFRYNMAYVAMYSPRPGATSARWEDNVPLDEKKRRHALLSEDLKQVSYEYNRSLIGTETTLLVEGRDRKPGYLTGKTEGRLIVRFPSDDESLIGEFVTVRLTDCAELSLTGELVGAPLAAEVGR
ncbi:MAG: tRNA (N6-isopentenyl adenosine(37)-C2)-methylthiotransferase MiaB [Spirochaetes bacterium]|jgi:tRNA-2-methylthio-N6-dimethylallyladenosine synthase|nr:tRNA (N6-isopentenyl adenosine(37)-C2)-methylthiotransferase MiaB [Spirochaetota bacterium]